MGKWATRLGALTSSIETVRRGGTVSITGVYGGAVNPMPLLLDDTDPLGTEGFATHHLPLQQAPHGYEIFQKKQEGCQKVVLRP